MQIWEILQIRRVLYILGATCEEEGMEDIPFGEARREEEGAVYR